MTTWATGEDLTKAEEKEVRRVFAKAAKFERQVEMEAFVVRHGISCFKCSSTFQDWAKTGMSQYGRPWAICVRCVREKKGAA